MDYRDDMVFVGFLRMSALIWYAARYCEQSGSDSTGQNVKWISDVWKKFSKQIYSFDFWRFDVIEWIIEKV